jgi:hypothetical protein
VLEAWEAWLAACPDNARADVSGWLALLDIFRPDAPAQLLGFHFLYHQVGGGARGLGLGGAGTGAAQGHPWPSLGGPMGGAYGRAYGGAYWGAMGGPVGGPRGGQWGAYGRAYGQAYGRAYAWTSCRACSRPGSVPRAGLGVARGVCV